MFKSINKIEISAENIINIYKHLRFPVQRDIWTNNVWPKGSRWTLENFESIFFDFS